MESTEGSANAALEREIAELKSSLAGAQKALSIKSSAESERMRIRDGLEGQKVALATELECILGQIEELSRAEDLAEENQAIDLSPLSIEVAQLREEVRRARKELAVFSGTVAGMQDRELVRARARELEQAKIFLTAELREVRSKLNALPPLEDVKARLGETGMASGDPDAAERIGALLRTVTELEAQIEKARGRYADRKAALQEAEREADLVRRQKALEGDYRSLLDAAAAADRDLEAVSAANADAAVAIQGLNGKMAALRASIDISKSLRDELDAEGSALRASSLDSLRMADAAERDMAARLLELERENRDLRHSLPSAGDRRDLESTNLRLRVEVEEARDALAAAELALEQGDAELQRLQEALAVAEKAAGDGRALAASGTGKCGNCGSAIDHLLCDECVRPVREHQRDAMVWGERSAAATAAPPVPSPPDDRLTVDSLAASAPTRLHTSRGSVARTPFSAAEMALRMPTVTPTRSARRSGRRPSAATPTASSVRVPNLEYPTPLDTPSRASAAGYISLSMLGSGRPLDGDGLDGTGGGSTANVLSADGRETLPSGRTVRLSRTASGKPLIRGGPGDSVVGSGPPKRDVFFEYLHK